MKTWRIGRDLSQAEVAKMLEMSQAGYSKVEAGAVDTGLSNVAKAAEVTGLSVGELLGAAPSPGIKDALRTLTEAGFEVSVRQPIPAPQAPPGAERKGSHP